MSDTVADIQSMVDRVNEIAGPAGSPGSFWQEHDGWLFATQGGEIRDFLRVVNDRLVLSNAQRARTDENLVFSSPLLTDMEKFLTYRFCNSLRWDRRLPMLLVVSIPVTIDKVAPGFFIKELEQEPWYELRHRGDSIVRCGVDTELVKFSHYVKLSPEEIRASALDPGGKPHFTVQFMDCGHRAGSRSYVMWSAEERGVQRRPRAVGVDAVLNFGGAARWVAADASKTLAVTLGLRGRALGLPEGFFDGGTVRVDIPLSDTEALRMPSGNEAGANDQWIPGGKLPSGLSEAVIDVSGLDPGRYSLSNLSQLEGAQ